MCVCIKLFHTVCTKYKSALLNIPSLKEGKRKEEKDTWLLICNYTA